MTVIKAQLVLLSSFKKILVGNYETLTSNCGKIFGNFIINSHNSQVLCSEFSVTVQNV